MCFKHEVGIGGHELTYIHISVAVMENLKIKKNIVPPDILPMFEQKLPKM